MGGNYANWATKIFPVVYSKMVAMGEENCSIALAHHFYWRMEGCGGREQ
jgi:hypothetical protein